MAATALAAGVCSILMGVGANFPLALAPGMGLNAVIAFQVRGGHRLVADGDGPLSSSTGSSCWRSCCSACAKRSCTRSRSDLRRAIAVGIGLFIAFIGAVNARLVVVPAGTIVALVAGTRARAAAGDPRQPRRGRAAIALLGLIVIDRPGSSRPRRGAIVLGILRDHAWPRSSSALAHLPGRLARRAPQFDTLFAADSRAALEPAFVPLLLAIVMVDFFDTIGTVTAVGGAQRALARRRRAACRDSGASSPSIRSARRSAALFGASSVTSYIESASGIAEGARTGLHTVTVGVLFLPRWSRRRSSRRAGRRDRARAHHRRLPDVRADRKIDFDELDTAIPAFLIAAA